MPKKSKKNRKNSKPNVFKQTNFDSSQPADNSLEKIETNESKSSSNKVNEKIVIYNNSVALELRKMGIISSSLIVTLIILTFILG
tara:strand:+ start:923 stop:1177 length:255 start_codon:yes stop_codon:yes gene_type:complete